MSDLDRFEQSYAPPTPTLASDGEAHAQLKRNLAVALEVHRDFMVAERETAGDKRLALEAANMTVKAALTTDRTALKARQENTLERLFLNCLFQWKRMGRPLKPEESERLRTAPRAEIEAALVSPRQIAEYDAMEF